MCGYAAYTLHPSIGLERGRVLQGEKVCTSFNAIADKVISLACKSRISDFYKEVDILNMPPLYCTTIKILDCKALERDLYLSYALCFLCEC